MFRSQKRKCCDEYTRVIPTTVTSPFRRVYSGYDAGGLTRSFGKLNKIEKRCVNDNQQAARQRANYNITSSRLFVHSTAALASLVQNQHSWSFFLLWVARKCMWADKVSTYKMKIYIHIRVEADEEPLCFESSVFSFSATL